MQKVLSAIGTIVVVVIALVVADQVSGAIERYRARKTAAKLSDAKAADASASGAGDGSMRAVA